MSDVGPFDPDELVRWAENYGHPEEWAKRAQAAHARACDAEDRLREAFRAGWNASGEGFNGELALPDAQEKLDADFTKWRHTRNP